MTNLQRAARTRKLVYLGLIVGLFTLSMFWRGKLAVGDPTADDPTDVVGQRLGLNPQADGFREAVAARLGLDATAADFEEQACAKLGVPYRTRFERSLDRLAKWTVAGQATDLELSELEMGDPEIAGSAARVSLVGLRGVVVTVLWSSAIEKQKRHEYHDFELYARLVTRLQPNFITPWLYQGWNISYNVSVENERLGDMFFFIARGIELLSEGDRLNTKQVRRSGIPKDRPFFTGSPDLRRDIAFFYQNKFTVSDKVTTLRCLMALAVLPPDKRSPARLRKPNSAEVDEGRFREFCEENPQLVRRLVTPRPNPTLGEKVTDTIAGTPPEIADFLAANVELPTRWEKNGRLKADEAQFPTLPPAFDVSRPDDEYHPRHPDLADRFDRFDALLAARAWFQYAQVVVPPPPPDGLASAAPDPKRPRDFAPGDPNAEYKFRMPQHPALIVFRYYPSRAQSYLAERLQKEGWYDAQTAWQPDFEVFFPGLAAKFRGDIDGLDAKAAAEVRPAEKEALAKAKAEKVREFEEVKRKAVFVAGRNSLLEWREAAKRWAEFGKQNGLAPEPAEADAIDAAFEKTRNLLKQDRPLPHDLSPSELAKEMYGLSPDEQAALPTLITPLELRMRKAHDYQPQNLQVTNFRRFRDESLAESTEEMVSARKRLTAAETRRQAGDQNAAIAEYAAAIAEWRLALDGPKTRGYHRGDRSEPVHEYSFELEQKLTTLFKEDTAVKQQVEATLAGLQAAVPAVTAADPRGLSDRAGEPALLAVAPFASLVPGLADWPVTPALLAAVPFATLPATSARFVGEPDPFGSVALSRKDYLQAVAEEKALTEIAVRMRMRALDPKGTDTTDATEKKARAEVADPAQYAYLKRFTAPKRDKAEVQYPWVRPDIRETKLQALGFRRKPPEPAAPPPPLPGDPPRQMPAPPAEVPR